VRRIAADLSRLRKRHAVVGALAVSARVEPRFTRDADFAVAVSGDEEAEPILRDLTAAGYRVDALVEQEEMQRLVTTRLVLGDEEEERVVLDLLFASCGIEPEIADAAEPLAVFADVVLPVARTGHLIAMKLLSRDAIRRPQDEVDLRALLREADANEIERAREGVRLIVARSMSRGKDLVRELEAALQESAR